MAWNGKITAEVEPDDGKNGKKKEYEHQIQIKSQEKCMFNAVELNDNSYSCSNGTR